MPIARVFLDIRAEAVYFILMFGDILFAGLGGFLGSALRCAVGFVPVKNPAGFPAKTLLINVAGCFLFALAGCLAAKNRMLSPRALVLIRTGFCGGFTTFSAFAAESAGLVKNGNYGMAAAYIAASITFGLLVIFATERMLAD